MRGGVEENIGYEQQATDHLHATALAAPKSLRNRSHFRNSRQLITLLYPFQLLNEFDLMMEEIGVAASSALANQSILQANLRQRYGVPGRA